MNKKVILSVLSLLALVACNGKGGSETSSFNESSSSESSSSYVPKPTAELTDAMFSGIKQGYRAEVFSKTAYEGSRDSVRILDLSVNEFNASVKTYSTDRDNPTVKLSLSKDNHYQINPDEKDTKMLYDAGLSIGNEVIYTPVKGKDPHTYEEVDLTWDEGYYSNAFKDVTKDYFTKVDDNSFSLDLNNATLDSNHTYDKIMTQLLGEEAGSECQSFILKTDGDRIAGFELTYEAYSSSDTIIQRSSSGNFLVFGADVVDYIKPLVGTEDEGFKQAIDKLKTLNFEAEQKQQNFNFETNKFYVSGIYKYKIENGKKIDYDIYVDDNTKWGNGGYYEVTNPENPSEKLKQSVIKIKDEFYEDYLYSGSMEEFLPKFKISSLCFVKDATSTSTKQVWKLNENIRFSLNNDINAFTPFDSDGYPDRIIHLTITIEENKINIHNETMSSAEADRGGLIFDANYTNFGKVVNLMPENKIHKTCDELKWSDLISNNESGSKKLMETFPKDVLDTIPTIGGTHSDIYVDGKALYIYIYDLEDAKEIFAAYKTKLTTADYEVQAGTDDELGATLKSKQQVTIGTRKYYINIQLSTFWNNMLEFGQFQIWLSLSSN